MSVYKGIAAGHCAHEELIDFLNYIFGMNGRDSGFYQLLPKLYRPALRPEEHNFVVLEDGKLRGAVGSYPWEMTAGGQTLRVMGIGNVAAHPFHQGQGYMKDCMKLALDDMIEKKADFSVLGGLRQRYGYFGFAAGGVCGKFTLNSANLRHVFGSKTNPGTSTCRKLTQDDEKELNALEDMAERQPNCVKRDRSRLFDILSSWQAEVYGVLDAQGELEGYFLLQGDNVSEIGAETEDAVRDVLYACNAAAGKWEISLRVPLYNRFLFDALGRVAEDCQIVRTELYNVLCYENVIRAYLAVKASCGKLEDGCVTLCIDGYAGQEKLKLMVAGGVPTVEPFAGECDKTYDHLTAMRVLFGICAPEREELPLAVRTWFPLPLYVSEVDNV